MATYYIDGEFVDSAQATIPADDLAVLRGYGAFDFLRTYNGKPFELDAHIDRLFTSADLLMIGMPWSRDQIREIVMDTLSRNTFDESNVRIVVTGGYSASRLVPEDKPRLLVMIDPATTLPDTYYRDGVKIVTFNHERYLPRAKSINYTAAIIAMKYARTQDAIDALFVDDSGVVLEGTTNNLFAFYRDTLVTHEGDDILPGITRNLVLDLAKDLYTIETRDITVAELYDADETFLTSSIKEVLPLRQIDDHVYGAPGERTRALMTKFAEYAGIPVKV